MAIDLSVNPYDDDFNADKNYHRILFKPSYAVQARELTQSQTILQNQISSFGKNIFAEGSIVTGGQTTLETTGVYYVAVEATDPTGNPIVLSDWIGTHITDGDGLGVRAYVIAAQESTDTTPTTLIVKYLSGQHFPVTLVQPIVTEDASHSVRLLTSVVPFPGISSITGNSSICSIQDGVFFIGGYFVQVTQQTVILEAYTTTPTYRVGLQLDDAIITASADASLLDPAQDSSNYQAQGADRYQVTLTLSKRSLTSTDDSKFIELIRVSAGTLTKKVVYPTYSVLEDTLARRTNDQSGSFTVHPFKVSPQAHATLSNAYNIVVESGKAYVQGYEFETIAPTVVKSDRSRSVTNVANYGITVDYQNYINLTKLVGALPLQNLQAGMIHCVNTASINVVTSTAASNTAIGSLRIRALEYDSGANGTSISTGIWRAYTVDANVGSSPITNSSTTGTTTTIALGTLFSAVSNAYVGVKLTVTANAGVPKAEYRTIGSYDGTTKIATLQAGQTFSFGIPGSMTQFRLDYELKDAESIVWANTTVANVFGTSADVDISSKEAVAVDPYQGAFITDTSFNRMLFQFPYPTIADQAGAAASGGLPITSSEFFGRKIYPGVSFVANVISLTSATGITSVLTGSPLSGTDAQDNILVVMRSGTAGVAAHQVINFSTGNPRNNNITVSTAANASTWTINVPDAATATADVYVKVRLPYSHTIGGILRSKSSKIATITTVDVSGGTTITDSKGLVQWYSQSGGANGVQLTAYANSAAWLALRKPGTPQSVFTSDVTKLRAIYDFGKKQPTTANIASAVNITSRYTLASGQKDNSYDHATVTLKPTSSGPSGNVAIYLDYFTHSGLGYLTVDSYIAGGVAYANVPTYTSTVSGHVYQLRDCVDFRPRRNDAETVGIFGEELFPTSGLSFETDFSYYLARIDKLVLTKNRNFEVIQGVPSLFPVPPSDKDNAMTLYTLILPPYTANTADIQQRYVDNRRYTMRDIGALEKRISNMEYYTSLNMLEQAAKNQEITDDLGLSRFKNGIMVDPFTGHSIGDVLNEDYHCAMDTQEQEMRPPYASKDLLLTLDTPNSTNYRRTGALVTMNYTSNTLIDQSTVSQAISVNPFNTVSFIGQIQLDPSSDVWVDTNQAPDVLVNLTGDNDAWAALAAAVETINPGKIFGTTWNSWQTLWSGTSNLGTNLIFPGQIGWQGPIGHYVPIFGNVVSRTTAELTQSQVRTGITTSFVPSTITQSIGNKVIDSSIVPYIRSRGVLFIGKMLAPNTQLWSYFDGTQVQGYINLPNIIRVASNTVKYTDTYQNSEGFRVWDGAAAANVATGLIVLSRNETGCTNVSVVNVQGGNDANVANAYFMRADAGATYLVGTTSGANSKIIGYYHKSGFVTQPNVSSIFLAHEIANSNNGISNTSYVGQEIFFTSSNGAGHSSTITSYNYITRNLTFTAMAANGTPTINTSYSLGPLVTDFRGECTGVFIIPSTSEVRFRTGERAFELVDSLNQGITTGSGTNGSVKYFAQGLLQTVDNTVISTKVPTIQRTILGQSQTVVTTKVTDTVVGRTQIGYWDPLAQTFLVDQKFHPEGVQLTGIRLLFKSKDPNIPVQIQLRPVVNGFPHSSQVIPGSDRVINSTEIITVSETALAARIANTAQSNPFDDATIYTEVVFDGPVYLPQGSEYAVVIMANSQKYEVYISELGKKVLGSTRLISDQPYLGVLFKSQNSTTWNPIQEQDLAFRLMYAQYNPALTADVRFVLSSSNGITANVPLDVFYVTSGNLHLPNTSITTLFSTTTSTGTVEDYKYMQLGENVYFDDTLGRRVATSSVNSFKLKCLLSSQNADISPVVDLDRLSVLAIENLVNTLGWTLGNNTFVVTDTSNTWTSANVTQTAVVISGGGGTGANAKITYTVNVDGTVNELSNVQVDIAGSGYTTAPTITITIPTSNATANIIVAGEDSPSGGPSVARYITRKVTLADGMDGGDFRVFFSAYKPSTAGIYVYYKILSADDSDSFDSKGYQLMTCIQGVNNLSLNQQDFKDFVFAPGTGNLADNRVQYGTFTSFKHFAIKVVMSSSDTTKAPRLRDFRVVALPAV